MCQGVSKSGSPMPSEMTSFIFGDDVKKVADARLGQVDDVLGDVTGGVHAKF